MEIERWEERKASKLVKKGLVADLDMDILIFCQESHRFE